MGVSSYPTPFGHQSSKTTSPTSKM